MRLLPLPNGDTVRICDRHEWASVPADPGVMPLPCPACDDTRAYQRYLAHAPGIVSPRSVIEAQTTAIEELQATVRLMAQESADQRRAQCEDAATFGALREFVTKFGA